MGTIALEGIQLYAYHGYYEEEQKLGGQYKIDVYITADLETSGNSDKLGDTINYEKVYEIVQEESAKASKLIEHVCSRIIGKLLHTFQTIESVKVRLYKLNPPLKGALQHVFVEIEKKR